MIERNSPISGDVRKLVDSQTYLPRFPPVDGIVVVWSDGDKAPAIHVHGYTDPMGLVTVLARACAFAINEYEGDLTEGILVLQRELAKMAH